jgi:hypothetical protein
LEQESARISGVLTVIENFWHHPLGVAWGSFDDLASSYYDAVSPHNWPAVALLYGGIISFAVAARFHVSMIGRLLDGKARARGRGDKFGDTLALVITCVACSWFEQAFQTGITLFTFLLAWAGCSALLDGKADRRLLRPSLPDSGYRKRCRPTYRGYRGPSTL